MDNVRNFETRDNLYLQPHMVDYVIYHGNCTDGIAAKYAAERYLQMNFPERQVTYHAGYFKDPPPKDILGKNVLICDYSYRNDVLLQMLTQVKTLLIIDHHKSAEKDLADIPVEYKIFDMHHSGCWLTWKYFFPEEKVPLLYEYIQDHDIWTKKMPQIEEFVAWFYSLPIQSQTIADYLDEQKLLQRISVNGTAYLALNDHYIESALKKVTIKFQEIKGKYYLVGYVNFTVLESQVGNAVMKKYPYLDFAVVWRSTGDDTLFSLRSVDDRVDVSEVAFKLGGGGHRNASGLSLPYVTNQLPGKVHGDYRMYDLLTELRREEIDQGGKTFGALYLYAPQKSRKLGKYLLQTRQVQKGQEIPVWRSLLPDAGDCQMAVVWSYHGGKDQTKFTVSFAESLSPTEVQALQQKLLLNEKGSLECNGIDRNLLVILSAMRPVQVIKQGA